MIFLCIEKRTSYKTSLHVHCPWTNYLDKPPHNREKKVSLNAITMEAHIDDGLQCESKKKTRHVSKLMEQRWGVLNAHNQEKVWL